MKARRAPWNPPGLHVVLGQCGRRRACSRYGVGVLDRRGSEPYSRDVASSGPVSCALCGTSVVEVPLTWISSMERGRLVYYCDACSRENLRSIEGKLDSEYW
jgi:hypothetical protein